MGFPFLLSFNFHSTNIFTLFLILKTFSEGLCIFIYSHTGLKQFKLVYTSLCLFKVPNLSEKVQNVSKLFNTCIYLSHSCVNLYILIQTSTSLSRLVQTCPYLSRLVQTCPFLFRFVQNCPNWS